MFNRLKDSIIEAIQKLKGENKENMDLNNFDRCRICRRGPSVDLVMVGYGYYKDKILCKKCLQDAINKDREYYKKNIKGDYR